ncbi:MAG: ABC transporter substrate-binding protein [Acidobacteriota bacterium]
MPLKRRQFLALGARAAAVGAGFALAGPRDAWGQGSSKEGDAGISPEVPARSRETTAGDTPPLKRVPGLNAVEIRLGMTGDFSGPSAPVAVDALRGALAWLNETNDLGGIEGRHLTLLPLDDGGNPRRAVQNVRTFLEDPAVFCLFNLVGTAPLGAILPILRSRRGEDLWLLGELSGAEAARSAPYAPQVFPVRPSHRLEMAALVRTMVTAGERAFGVLHPLNAHGRSGADAARRAIVEAGARPVAEAAWRYGNARRRHLEAAMQHLKRQGAEAVVIAGDGAVAAEFVGLAHRGGWRPAFGIGAVHGGDGWYPELAAVGTLGDEARVWTSRPVPLADTPGLPALEELERLLLRWRPKPPASLGAAQLDDGRTTASAIEGFLNARLLTAALRLAGPWPTRRTVADALGTLQSYDLGIRAPVSYPEDGDRGLRRVTIARWRGGRFRTAEPAGSAISEFADRAPGEAGPDAPDPELPSAPAPDTPASDTPEASPTPADTPPESPESQESGRRPAAPRLDERT